MGNEKRIGKTRADGVKFPDSAPPGWTHIKLALCAYGGEILPKGCVYNFFEIGFHGAVENHKDLKQAEINREHANYARRNMRRLADEFNAVCHSGAIVTGYSALGGGRVEILDPTWWFTTDPMLRYRTFSIDPAHPFSESVDLPCWIWVEQESLAVELERLRRKRNGWGPIPKAPDPEPFIIDFSDSDGPGRPAKTPHILEMFRSRVEAGTVESRPQWEGKAIHDMDVGNPRRATAKTIADNIRPYHKMIQWAPDGTVANREAIIAAIDNA